MALIKNVVVAGYGRYGKPAVDELSRAGFKTTVFTRDAERRKKDVPDGVAVQQVDYDSLESLETALRGQDAIVCTVTPSAVPNQKLLIDAAINARVKHYIPAESTIESQHPEARRQPILNTVIDIQNYLIDRQDKIQWNVISVGAWIEMTFEVPFIIDFDARHAVLWGDGEGRVSIGDTRLAAKAVAAVLKDPSKVKDHVVRVHGTTLSQNQVLQLAKRFDRHNWTVEHKSAEAGLVDAQAILQKANQDGSAVDQKEVFQATLNVYATMIFGDGHFDGAYSNPDNDRFGIDYIISEEDIEKAIRSRVERGSASNASS